MSNRESRHRCRLRLHDDLILLQIIISGLTCGRPKQVIPVLDLGHYTHLYVTEMLYFYFIYNMAEA